MQVTLEPITQIYDQEVLVKLEELNSILWQYANYGSFDNTVYPNTFGISAQFQVVSFGKMQLSKLHGAIGQLNFEIRFYNDRIEILPDFSTKAIFGNKADYIKCQSAGCRGEIETDSYANQVRDFTSTTFQTRRALSANQKKEILKFLSKLITNIDTVFKERLAKTSKAA